MSFERYRKYTQARIGLGHSGPGLPTKSWLSFALHHASAVDAIKLPWELNQQAKALSKMGLKTEILQSRVESREQYLHRPDLGRLLSDESSAKLQSLGPSKDITLVISNGLSSLAASSHANNFVSSLCAGLSALRLGIAHNRIFLVENARVALLDDIGEILRPSLGLILIGERPGLSAPDSLAAYLCYKPRKGLTDANRNCISNIRPPHGLRYEQATQKLLYLIAESLRRKLSGVALKEESGLIDLNARRIA
jgi:ethanolamine ammonia-lyase small subunit